MAVKKRSIIPQDKSKRRSKPFPIVAIGASAGGLEAITELLKNLSPNTGMAYVYLQHLDPTHESMLSTILSKSTRMKVHEASNKMFIEANHLYVLPPNKEMSITDGVLKLSPRPAKPNLSNPINLFFTSLAEKQKEGAVGIVLSGNASDGALGLKAIKFAGGLTFAQDESAKFQSMPKSAVAEGAVDLVLSPREIAEELERLSKQSSVLQTAMIEADEEGENDNQDLNGILVLLNKSTGVDFSHYKKSTIRRRVVRRMLLYKHQGLKEYAQYLRQHTGEINVLYQDLLINVTTFFRDKEATEFVKKNILPKILKIKTASDPIRIWVPACSTGEEAYSLAIILMEVLGDNAAGVSIQIFATDLSEMAIAKARLGIYSKDDLADMSPKRLQKFFLRVDGSYRIIKSIRDLCVFAPHNIFKDAPFSRLDLVSCCNLLIYLDTVLQKKAMATFHYALNPNGYVILGKSETIGTSTNFFTPMDKKVKVFQRKKDSNSRQLFEPTYRLPEYGKVAPVKFVKEQHPKDSNISDLEKTVDSILLNRYVPASVVVNADLEILQFRGSTGLFLEPAPGKASLNLLKMARAGLGFELRNAIHKVNRSSEPFKKTGLEIKYKNHTHQITVEVVPVKTDAEKYFLLLFEDMPVPVVAPASLATRDKRVKQLEQEVMASREDMRSIVEEQEAVNEELQSANEEIVSSNEELQSINEELETSKEEIESTNEELMTINQEMQMRNEQLAELSEYNEAIISTIREGVIVLDSSLRVRVANKSFYRTFHVKEEDIEGRLIYDLGNGQWDIPQLRRLLEDIVPLNTQFNGFEVQHTFPEIGEKIMVLNARRIIQKVHRQELVLLAIEDVTEHVMAQRLIAQREQIFRTMANNAPVMIWTSGTDKQGNFFNKTWLEFTGKKLEEEVGTGWMDSVHPDDRDKWVKFYFAAFETQEPYKAEYRLRRYDGEYRWVLVHAKPSFDNEGKFSGYIGSVTDIHDKKMFAEELEQKVKERTIALREANRTLGQSNEELSQFAYVASHDLQEPLRKIIMFSDRVQKESGKKLPAKSRLHLQKVMDSALQMRELIEDLLNLSRAVANEKYTTVDLNKAVKDTLIDFELTIKEKHAKINIRPLPAVKGAPVQIKQLFNNLLGNALKFTKPNVKPIISIQPKKLTSRDMERYPKLQDGVKYIKLSVSDNGIGFQQEFANKIFVIFQRLNEKGKYPGTGIGLALCKKIVTNHGGEIYVESKVNKGATFYIILPVG